LPSLMVIWMVPIVVVRGDAIGVAIHVVASISSKELLLWCGLVRLEKQSLQLLLMQLDHVHVVVHLKLWIKMLHLVQRCGNSVCLWSDILDGLFVNHEWSRATRSGAIIGEGGVLIGEIHCLCRRNQKRRRGVFLLLLALVVGRSEQLLCLHKFRFVILKCRWRRHSNNVACDRILIFTNLAQTNTPRTRPHIPTTSVCLFTRRTRLLCIFFSLLACLLSFLCCKRKRRYFYSWIGYHGGEQER